MSKPPSARYLTKNRQRHAQILELLFERQARNLPPPTIREICRAVRISSTSVAVYYLQRMQEDGVITIHPRISRGIVLNAVPSSTSELVRIPVIGKLCSNLPIPTPAAR